MGSFGVGRPSCFGKAMLKHFSLDPEYTNLNSASCGTCPKVVQEAMTALNHQFQAQPDVFVEFKQAPLLEEARACVASLLNVPAADCVFIKNATTGIYTVLQNLQFNPGDVVVSFSTTYGAVQNALTFLAETRPIRCRTVHYEFPIGVDDLVSRFIEVVDAVRREGSNPLVAIFDTIVSVPGLRFPFEQLTEACRHRGVLSLIDAAHSIGHLKLDLESLDPDFFVTDCHKSARLDPSCLLVDVLTALLDRWLNVPRGCAVLYAAPRQQSLFRATVPPSFGFIQSSRRTELPLWAQQGSSDPSVVSSPFQTLFALVPTADDTPYLCIPAAISFRRNICGGEERIYAYLQSLAQDGADRMAAILETEVLQEPGLLPGQQSLMRSCGVASVRLPLAIGDRLTTRGGWPYPPLRGAEPIKAVQFLSAQLAHRHKTWLPIFDHAGWLWVRVCAQVYLEVGDFEWVADVLKDLCRTVGQRDRAFASHEHKASNRLDSQAAPNA